MIKESVWTIGDVNPKCPFKGTGQVKLMSAKIDAKPYPNLAADIFLILH